MGGAARGAARRRRVAAAAALAAHVACRTHPPPDVASPRDRAWWPAPSDDIGPACADVMGVRACWDEGGSARLLPRPVPPFAAPTPLGFRCVGRGTARACAARDEAADAFVATPAGWTQPHPRAPDDGEWTCADAAGATVCVGAELAAGVSTGPAPSEWICGARRAEPAARDRLGSRVCIDLAPDFPEGSAAGLRCRYLYERGVRRECVRDPQAHVLADPCDAQRPCVDGALCASSRCVPPRPDPSCWLDADCPGGVCRFGSCAERGP